MNIEDVAIYIGLRIFMSFLLIVFLSQTWAMLMAGPFAPVAYLLLAAAVPGIELVLYPVFAVLDEFPNSL